MDKNSSNTEELISQQYKFIEYSEQQSQDPEMKEVAAAMVTNPHFDAIATYTNESAKNRVIDVDDLSEESIDVFDLGFSKPITTMILRVMFCFSIMTNVDHGALPSGIKAIQDDLGLQTAQMGNFGSLVFFGLAVGSMCATLIVSKFTWK
jgi:hypothetical protein